MNPSKVQARKMVLVSAFLLAAIAVYRDRQQGTQATFKALWGVAVVSLVLSIVADFVPQIAGPFAVVTVLGSLTSGGSNLIDKMLGTVSVAPTNPTPAGPRTTPSGTTASGTTNPPRPAAPPGNTPVGGTR